MIKAAFLLVGASIDVIWLQPWQPWSMLTFSYVPQSTLPDGSQRWWKDGSIIVNCLLEHYLIC